LCINHYTLLRRFQNFVRMRLKHLIALILISSLSIAHAQSGSPDGYIKKGVELHDQGKYSQAIEEYKQALKIDSKSPLANYEIGHTYFAMHEYAKAIKHADAVIKLKSNYVDQAYIMKGSALDLQGNAKGAIKSYKKGIKSFPKNYLLHYNIALTYYKARDLSNAEKSLVNAITVNPEHGSSHLLLAYIEQERSHRVKSLLATYHFLMLEPNSKRSESAYTLLTSQMSSGVTSDGDNTLISISLPNGDDEFAAAELMLAMLEATKSNEENENKTDAELFADNTDSFFSMLGELNDGKKGFWWEFYVDFFYEMHNEEHVEAMTYYVSQVGKKTEVLEWIKNNDEKIDSMSEWFSDYKK
jgi:TPR repeat/Tetratricopeptide repeat